MFRVVLLITCCCHTVASMIILDMAVSAIILVLIIRGVLNERSERYENAQVMEQLEQLLTAVDHPTVVHKCNYAMSDGVWCRQHT